MNESTPPTTEPASTPVEPAGDSQVFGVSVRAWLAVFLVATVCLICVADTSSAIYVGIVTSTMPNIEVREPLYSMFVASISFYFGQKNKGTG